MQVRFALNAKGWQETFDEDWNLYWAWGYPLGINTQEEKYSDLRVGKKPLHPMRRWPHPPSMKCVSLS